MKKTNRFEYIPQKKHGKRMPSFVRDYLTRADYIELEKITPLLNQLWHDYHDLYIENIKLKKELIKERKYH